ncbi:Protein of unknown function [Pyronema omphalodes CBS 100304]|uniref:Uncharacterized protein n=1 Tax=Pyronema omphalodes (strain CBS 100304) TaxID=1076935 RepID=U4L8Y1_PYROM|nr:Protein of unknown function [Pyronema omphalodes CBS 100304]
MDLRIGRIGRWIWRWIGGV